MSRGMRWGDEAAAWVALRAAPGIGDVAAWRLVEQLGGASAVLEASATALAAVGVPAKQIAALGAVSRDDAVAEVERVRRAGARIVARSAEEYPPLLRNAPDAPLYLTIRGQLDPAAAAIAVVGARRATPYGRDVAARLAEDLAHAGVSVVSGLARGIDGAAHDGALRSAGHTVAVLGSGIDVVYPPEHRELAERIAETGALVSERPVGTIPRPEHFPARNRIIAAMTLGTVVVEAAERSGSLITARLALEYGREVCAVPGRIDSPLSAGTHRLIQEGAKLTASLDDIVSEIGPALADRIRSGRAGVGQSTALSAPHADAAEPLLGLFAAGPLSIDQIIRESGRPASEVLAWVFEQEISGRLDQLPGKLFQLHRV